jgi:hypothetical protein
MKIHMNNSFICLGLKIGFNFSVISSLIFLFLYYLSNTDRSGVVNFKINIVVGTLGIKLKG